MTMMMERKLLDRDGTWDYIGAEWFEVKEGTRWECIRCSDCCRKDWAINLTWKEYDRLRADPRVGDLPGLGLEVDPQTGLDHPYFRLNGACPMLRAEGAVCTLYPDWPYTCAVYPFLLLPDGRLMAHKGCIGFGHGGPVDIERWKGRVLDERAKAGMVRDR